jgi:hypothetical protein
MKFGFIILATALLISGTAEYYSIMGLVAIFAAATVPVIVMGAALGIGKIVATVWTHNNWNRIPWKFKAYLVPAIAFLMVLTSMGIFGFLSKAHLEQATATGDAQAQVALFDDKIKTEQDNIQAARNALKQMDATVDQTISRTTDAGSVQSAANLRRKQATERASIQKDIAAAQKNIAKLQEERAPLAMQSRKIEAEVGPVKYIAALIYGDNPDANLLERAVRWVIILIVAVFDPLALCLILAANLQFEWARRGRGGYVHDEDDPDNGTPSTVPASDAIVQDPEPVSDGKMAGFEHVFGEHGLPVIPDERIPPMPEVPVILDGETEDDVVEIPEMASEWDYVIEEPVAAEEEEVVTPTVIITPEERIARLTADIESKLAHYQDDEDFDPESIALADEALERIASAEQEEGASSQENVAGSVVPVQPAVPEIAAIPDLLNITDDAAVPVAPAAPKMVEVVTEYVDPNTRIKSFEHNWVPETEVDFSAVADNDGPDTRSDFGTEFPARANKGDMYLRVDYLPARLFKYNGVKWMEVDKTKTDSYTFNTEYIKFLIEKLDSGEYSVEDLSEAEQDQIAEYLNK